MSTSQGVVMPESLPQALRVRVLEAYENQEGTIDELAERFKVSRTSITRWRAAVKKRGDCQPLPHGGGQPPAFQEEDLKALHQLVLQNPDATEKELVQIWPKPVSVSALHRALDKLGLTRKKNSARR